MSDYNRLGEKIPSDWQARAEAAEAELQIKDRVATTLEEGFHQMRAEVERLKRRASFMLDTDERDDSGWCGDHPRMYSLRPGADDGPCLMCEVERLKTERDKAGEILCRLTPMKNYDRGLVECAEDAKAETAEARRLLERAARCLPTHSDALPPACPACALRAEIDAFLRGKAQHGR